MQISTRIIPTWSSAPSPLSLGSIIAFIKDYDLDKRTLTKIDNYMSKEGLQNQKGLDKYIDQILTEKAERKKNK